MTKTSLTASALSKKVSGVTDSRALHSRIIEATPRSEARNFAELANGVCRIAAPLTHELALTLPHWRECLRPIAAKQLRVT